MSSALLLIYGLLGSWQLGIGVIRLLDGGLARFSVPAPTRPRAEVWGLGIILGMGLTSWLQLVWGLPGGALGRPCSLAIATIGWILGLATRRLAPGPDARQTSSSPRLVPACQIGIAALFLSAFVQTLITPQRFWDERAFYGIKAAVLFEDRSLHSPALHDPDFVQGHPRYPLLVPLAELHVYSLLGEVNDRWSKVIFPLLYLGLLFAFAGVVERNFDAQRGWLFALLLGTVPALFPWEYGFICGQADAPLACYHGAAVLCLWDGLRSLRNAAGRRLASFLFAGIFTGLAAFTKDEGIAYLLVDLIAFAALPAGRGPFSWKTKALSWGACLIPSGLVLAPWLMDRRGLPTTTEMTYFSRLSAAALASGGASLAWSARHVLGRMFLEAREWGLHWWGMLFSAVACPRQALTASQLFLMLDVLGAVAALVVAGMIAPTTVEEHIGGSSHRFLLQISPVAVLFIAGQWGPASNQENQSPERDRAR